MSKHNSCWFPKPGSVITIIELFNHHEVVVRLVERLPECKINLLISESTFPYGLKEISQHVSNMYVRPSSIDIYNFLLTHYLLFEESDFIIITTIENNYSSFVKIKWPKSTILFVHNGNYWLDYWRNIYFCSIKDVTRFVFSLLSLKSLQRQKILSAVDAIMIAGTSSMIEHFKDRSLFLKEKKVCSFVNFVLNNPVLLPLKSPKLQIRASNGQEFKLALLGSLDERIRLYNPVISALKQVRLPSQYCIHLIIIGNIKTKSSERIVRDLCRTNIENIRVSVFNEELSLNYYRKLVQDSDACLLPLRSEICLMECREYGGRTKHAGTLLDIYELKKTAIIPSHYPIQEVHGVEVYKYSNSSELCATIEMLALRKLDLRN